MPYRNLSRGRPTSSAPKTGTTAANNQRALTQGNFYSQKNEQFERERAAAPKTTYTASGARITRAGNIAAGTTVKNRATGQSQTLSSVRNGQVLPSKIIR